MKILSMTVMISQPLHKLAHLLHFRQVPGEKNPLQPPLSTAQDCELARCQKMLGSVPIQAVSDQMTMMELKAPGHKSGLLQANFDHLLERVGDQNRLSGMGVFPSTSQAMSGRSLDVGNVQGNHLGLHRRVISAQPPAQVLGDSTNTRVRFYAQIFTVRYFSRFVWGET